MSATSIFMLAVDYLLALLSVGGYILRFAKTEYSYWK